MGYYKIAQICRNGHVQSTDVERHSPGPRCEECGAEGITKCPHCAAPIHGYYHVEGVLAIGERFSPPKYCHNCGKPYPWTEVRLQALHELISEMEGVSAEEKQRLNGSRDDLIADTPRTEVAVTRFKKALARAGPEVAIAMKKILIEVGTEAVKKSLGI